MELLASQTISDAHERWMTVSGFDAYEVSSHGRLRRVKRARFGRPVPHHIEPYDSEGYCKVQLCQDGRRQRAFVHRLVALAFIGEQPEGRPEVAHRDGDKRNNRVGNLRWASYSENNIDKHAHGRMPLGTAHHWTKLEPEKALAVKRMIKAGHRTRDIVAAHGVRASTVADIRAGNSWAHLSVGDGQ